MAKKTPRYMLPTVVLSHPGGQNDGNKAIPLSHTVMELDIEGKVTGKRINISEVYTINQNHRNKPTSKKGVWKVGEDIELNSFQECRYRGSFTTWKDGTYKGWGVYATQIDSPNTALGCNIHILGSDYHRTDVKVCKFVEGNKGNWHGYPINYMASDEEVICDNALLVWANVLRIIEKSEITDIKHKEKSSLS